MAGKKGGRGRGGAKAKGTQLSQQGGGAKKQKGGDAPNSPKAKANQQHPNQPRQPPLSPSNQQNKLPTKADNPQQGGGKKKKNRGKKSNQKTQHVDPMATLRSGSASSHGGRSEEVHYDRTATMSPSADAADMCHPMPRDEDVSMKYSPVKEDDDDVEDVQREDSGEDYSDTANERKKEYKKGGYHPVNVGELYNQRYRVVHKLGWGYFSTVWLVWDYEKEKFSAMKVQKSAEHYRDAAFDEIKILSQIHQGDPDGEIAGSTCVHMTDYFEHVGPNGNHVVMVFDVLGENLLSLIERYDYKGIPLPIVKSIMRNMLVGLDYIATHLQILHTDIKPENVLLSMPKHKIVKIMKNYSPPQRYDNLSLMEKDRETMTKSQRRRLAQKLRKIRVQQESEVKGEAAEAKLTSGAANKGCGKHAADSAITAAEEDDSDTDPEWEIERFHHVCLADFGNGCWTYKQFTDEVSTRQYRAPEVILGEPYATPIDVWSTACLLFELLTGEFLFDPKQGDNYSRDEDHLALMVELLGEMPDHMACGDGKYRAQFLNSRGEFRHIKELKHWPLESVLHDKYGFTRKKAVEIAQFVYPMLAFDPAERATAKEMLEHFESWFEVQEDDYPPHCYRSADDLDGSERQRHQGEGRGEANGEVPMPSLDEELANTPLLSPENLAKLGLTVEDVKTVLEGGELKDDEKMAMVHHLLGLLGSHGPDASLDDDAAPFDDEEDVELDGEEEEAEDPR